jgi:hypothetical protein
MSVQKIGLVDWLEAYFNAKNGRRWHIAAWVALIFGLVGVTEMVMVDWLVYSGNSDIAQPYISWLYQVNTSILRKEVWAIALNVVSVEFLTVALAGGFIALNTWSCEYGPAAGRAVVGRAWLRQLRDDHSVAVGIGQILTGTIILLLLPLFVPAGAVLVSGSVTAGVIVCIAASAVMMLDGALLVVR